MRTFKDTRGKSWFNIVDELDYQIDITISYPGTIRAFHYHNYKTEWMYVVDGEYKFVLAKEGEEPKVFFLSQGEVIKIESGIWHGYQVQGESKGIMMEVADKKHDIKNPDDLRKPYDAFDDWEKEKK